MTKKPLKSIPTPSITTTVVDSFATHATPEEFAKVAKAIPMMYARAAELSNGNDSLDIRVGKTLSNGRRRIAFRVFRAGKSRPIYTTSPDVVLGLRKHRTAKAS